MNSKIDVTIFCLTYNHVKFIKDALEGFLKQNTRYTYNVFVYDDASTDGTSEILRKYGEKYPQIFDVYISDKNMYMSPDRDVFLMNLYRKHIVGRYVAWCEGDDYWIDSNKLQEQIDYMEEHRECAMVAHGCIREDFVKRSNSEYRPYKENQILSPEQIILQKAGNLPTASLVMKKEILLRDEKFPMCDVGDIPMQLYALSKGEIYYIDKVMSVYRSMHDTSWSKQYHCNVLFSWKHRLGMVEFLKKYDEYSNREFHEYILTKARQYLYTFYMSDKQNETDILVRNAEQLNALTNYKYNKYITKQVEMVRTINETFYLSQEIKDFIRNKKYVVLMGTGEYSKQMGQKLSYESINIDGYVISDNQKLKENISMRPVWKVSEYPYKWEDTGLIVAVGSRFQTEIEIVLAEKNITEYYAPYWLDM